LPPFSCECNVPLRVRVAAVFELLQDAMRNLDQAAKRLAVGKGVLVPMSLVPLANLLANPLRDVLIDSNMSIAERRSFAVSKVLEFAKTMEDTPATTSTTTKAT
jgi:hypothetical protein